MTKDAHDLDTLDKTKTLTKAQTMIEIRKMLQDSNCLHIFIIRKILFYILSVCIIQLLLINLFSGHPSFRLQSTFYSSFFKSLRQ